MTLGGLCALLVAFVLGFGGLQGLGLLTDSRGWGFRRHFQNLSRRNQLTIGVLKKRPHIGNTVDFPHGASPHDLLPEVYSFRVQGLRCRRWTDNDYGRSPPACSCLGCVQLSIAFQRNRGATHVNLNPHKPVRASSWVLLHDKTSMQTGNPLFQLYRLESALFHEHRMSYLDQFNFIET